MKKPDQEGKMGMRKELVKTKLPKKFAMLESLLSPSGFFVVGDTVAIPLCDSRP
jgi:hypothetical protein